jgi:hypothetical protein
MTKPLAAADFKPVPRVVFLLENFNAERLTAACAVVRGKEFSEFDDYARQNLPTKSRYLKRLGELKNNWRVLRAIEFRRMAVDFSQLKSVLGERVSI